MIDILMIGFSIYYISAAYLWKSFTAVATFATLAGIFLNLELNSNFVKWLGNHSIKTDPGFLTAITSITLIVAPAIIASISLKFQKGKTSLRILEACLLGIITGIYLGGSLSGNATFSKLIESKGPLYNFSTSIQKPLLFLLMLIAIIDLKISRNKKIKED
jgi:hypothetical protein